MTKLGKLRLCDWVLLCAAAVMLVSALWLEINPFGPGIWVWFHILLGAVMVGFIIWHLALHKASKSGGKRGANIGHHHHGGRGLGLFCMLMIVSGIAATVAWLGTYTHSTIGGIHGKIGFIFLILVALHVRKYRRFYLPRRR
ncbi:MAG: hypothetical protein NC210_00170 [[Clostridium] fimetarium]|nr:hypothetical protein [Alistipes timonensis]MCM1404820.1 hypothetical protein [[Clostridium] fimetarium]